MSPGSCVNGKGIYVYTKDVFMTLDIESSVYDKF